MDMTVVIRINFHPLSVHFAYFPILYSNYMYLYTLERANSPSITRMKFSFDESFETFHSLPTIA